MNPLRVCRVCGLAAHTEAELELFKINKKSHHRRQNLCKRCHNKNPYKKEDPRRNEFIAVFRERSPDGLLHCYFCDGEVSKLKGQDSDSLNIHSLDGNHDNWDPANKVPTHYWCHLSHHKSGEKNHQWLGDEASYHTKYMRKWRIRKNAEWVAKEGCWEVPC